MVPNLGVEMIHVTERLIIGDYRDAHDFHPDDIHAVVSITRRPVSFDKPHFQLSIEDNQPWPIDEQVRLVRFIRDHIANRILVHCDAGISRSSSAVVLWLMAVGFSQDEAVGFVRNRHPHARPSPVILDSLVVVDLAQT